MNLVRSQTSIPVPRAHRVIRHIHPNGAGLIVMDLVKNGRQLHHCWPSLSIWEKLKVISTLRCYLHQLQCIKDSLHSDTPGPLTAEPGLCQGLQFGYDVKGPFPTKAALEEHFRKEHYFAEDRASCGYSPAPNCRPLPSSFFATLVFTHNDINMRNILLDDDGKIWLIDWGFSGFYPAWFEYTGMRYAAHKDKEPRDWRDIIRYIAKPDCWMENWMSSIGYNYESS
jgi:hypothetical protein